MVIIARLPKCRTGVLIFSIALIIFLLAGCEKKEVPTVENKGIAIGSTDQGDVLI